MYLYKGNFSLINRPFDIRLVLPGVQWRRSVGGSDEGGDGPNSQLSTGDFPDFYPDSTLGGWDPRTKLSG